MSSISTAIMKQLVDMNIIDDREDEIMSGSTQSSDKNYIIQFIRKPRLSLFNNTDSNFNCTISILNNLGVECLSIQTTEIEIYKLIDVMYQLIELEIGEETYFYFNPNNTNCISKLLKLELDSPFYTDIQYHANNSYILSIFDNTGEELIIRVSMKFTYLDIIDFIEKLYYVFLIDLPDDQLLDE